MRRGVITVYLSLVFILLVSLLLVLLESSRVYTIGTMSERYANMAAEMVFAGYVQPLAKQYDLLAVDMGNGQQKLEDFEKYLKMNLENEGNNHRAMGMYGQVKMDGISNICTLQDHHWKSLKSQAADYEKMAAVSKGIDKMQDVIGQLKNSGINEKTEDYMNDLESKGEEMDAAESEMEENESEAENLEGEEAEEPEMEDPRKGITGWLKTGVLNLVMDGMEVSGRRIDTSGCSWQTSRTKSFEPMEDFDDYSNVTDYKEDQGLLSQIQDGIEDQEENLLLNLYINDKFSSMTGSGQSDGDQSHRVLKYEYEYILYGKDSDRENLENAVMSICTLRTFLNLIYVYTSPAKNAELQKAIKSMKLLEKVPVAGEVIKLLIMACWSAAEAVVDCAGLAEGGKVPLIKSKSSWNLSMDDLQGIAKGGKRAADYFHDSGKGLDYNQYLMIFMFLTPSGKKMGRMSQLIECNVRLVKGYEDFSLARCAVQAEFSGTVKIGSKFYGHPRKVQHDFDVVYGY